MSNGTRSATKSNSTTNPTTTTTSTTTTSTTTTSEATTVKDIITTLVELTTSDSGSTEEPIDEPNADDPTSIILAIVLPAVACILLIILGCYLIYKRGERQRVIEKSLEFDSRITPKNTRPNKQKGQRLSAIPELATGTLDNSKTDSQKNDEHVKVKVENEVPQRSAISTETRLPPKGAEPEYENLAVPAAEKLDRPESEYVVMSRPSSTLVSDDANKRARNGTDTDGDHSNKFYENLMSNARYSNLGVPEGQSFYGKEERTESFYEEAIVKPPDDIYIDMD